MILVICFGGFSHGPTVVLGDRTFRGEGRVCMEGCRGTWLRAGVGGGAPRVSILLPFLSSLFLMGYS